MRKLQARLILAGLGAILIGLSAGALSLLVRRAHSTHPNTGKPLLLPGQDGDSTLLFNGWRINPAGRILPTGDMLLGGATSPDGKLLAISNCGYNAHALHIVDLATEKEIANLPMDRAWNGIAWSPDSAKIYVGGGISNERNDIYVFGVDDAGKWRERKGLKLTGNDPKQTCIAGLTISKDGSLLYALNDWDGNLNILDIASGKTLSHLPVGEHPIACKLSADGHLILIAIWGGSEIAVMSVSDPAAMKYVTHIPTGAHPNDIALSTDGRVFVSCGNDDEIDVFNAKDGKRLETIRTTLTAKSPAGSTPNAVAVSPDNKTLYAANTDNNDVCVIDISKPGQHRVRGFIPTGWYPTAVVVTPDSKRVIIGTGKGGGTGPNPVKLPIDTEAPKGFEHHGHQLKGMLAFVDAPNDAMLAEYTRQVIANTPYKDEQLIGGKSQSRTAIPTKLGEPSPIKHILYIIKENRTYDQVFGDVSSGNGDSKLCLFGDDVTPNHHALAQQFVLLDNLYCSGEVSQDGHPWSTSAYATDFTQRAWVLGYSGKGELWSNEKVEDGHNGYLWDACKRNGLTYRSYGEYTYASSSDAAPEQKVEGATGLKGHGSPSYVGIGRPKGSPDMRDIEKADAFIAEYRDFESKGAIPQFMVMSLGEDHTSGTKPGAYTPKASVASNDQALGRIVEAISRSKSWKEFAIFVIEDDAQNGPDHVDSHRTAGLVISPFTRRHIVDSTMYSTVSMIRTMELILGLPPLTQYDAAATAMYASFTNKADMSAYNLLTPRIDLNVKNKVTDPGAKASARLDFSGYDRADEDTLNHIIWESIKGNGVPMPKPVHRVNTVTHNNLKDKD